MSAGPVVTRMDSDQPATTPTPVFFEALAEAAKCSVPDAIEHFEAIRSSTNGRAGDAVVRFLDEYVAHA